jgi:hypothetical protein
MPRTSSKQQQQKAGIPNKRRGQQMGFAGNPDQNRQASADTPALRGRRKQANQMFADQSANEIGSSPVTPRTNSPSTPALTTGGRPGQTAGETAFKKHMKRAGK